MSKVAKILLVGAGLTFSAWANPAPAAEPTAAVSADKDSLTRLQQRFQAGLDAVCTKYALPGMTAAYVLPDDRVVAFASGLADKESGAKMGIDTRMPAGSIGKTFVAATTIALARDGKLSLDDKVEKWLGDAPWYDDLPNGREVTIRHLLMHRGGVADHIYDPQFLTEARQMVAALDTNPDKYFKPEELVRFILKRKPLFAPGQAFQYTDTGYILLGLVIERAGGASYYDQVRERFLVPLKLTLTEPSDHRDIPNLAAGYLAAKNPFGLPQKITADGKLRYNPATEWTGGGLASNPQDLARWAKTLYEGRALQKPYLDELLAADSPDKDQAKRYGLGVYVTKNELGTSYGHGGWSVGYLSHVDYYPAQRVAVALQVNTDVRDDMLGDLMSLIQEVLETVGKMP
jgi:D-alanyl-D-alanine carboxypeptidase